MIIGETIRKYRQGAGMSQGQLSGKLGISRPAISQIENNERNVRPDELRKLAEIFNTSADILLGMKKEPEVVITRTKESQKIKSAMRISVPQKSMEKFREILLYILNKVGAKPNIGETVIYKLLYFIDFNFYEKYEEQLIGATYMKNKYGPTPVEFKKLLGEMGNDIEMVDSEYFSYPQTKYLPKRMHDLSKLSANEIKIIDDVLNRLSDLSARQISEYSHSDVPWQAATEGGIIDYEAVFYRNTPYSVRDYGDEY